MASATRNPDNVYRPAVVGLIGVAGSNVTIRCTANLFDDVRWEFSQTSSDTYVTVYSGGRVLDNLSQLVVNQEQNHSVLIVPGASQSDAGLYRCRNSRTTKVKENFGLTILGSNPQCRSNVTSTGNLLIIEEHEHISVGCEVCFTGVVTVNINCVSDMEERFISHPRETVDQNDTCRLYRKTYMSTRQIQDSQFSCTVWFTYDNVSLFNYSWTSDIVKTHFGPKSARIHVIHKENNGLMTNGDILNCTADSFPEASYRWQVADTPVHDGALFVVDVCKLIDGRELPVGPEEITRSVTVHCLTRRDNKLERQSITVNVSVVGYEQRCRIDDGTSYSRPTAVNPLFVYLAIFVSVVIGLL
jgi:hypothetical protein